MKTHLLKHVLLLCVLFLCSGILFAQKARKPADLVQDAVRKNETFTPLRIQPMATDAYRSSLSRQVSSYSLFSFTRSNVDARSGTPLELQLSAAGSTFTLQLVPVNIYAEGFLARTSSGEKIASTGWFYQGIIKGNSNSVAAISIFDDEIAGFIGSEEGNYVIGKLRNTGNKDAVNIIYKESALSAKPSFNCGTPDITLPIPPVNETALTNRCVRIYYETEVDFYTAFGNNSTAVTNYVTNLFNQNKTLYNNDGVSVALSEIFVWTTTDPYNGGNSGSLLGEFQSVRTSFNGDLGQLITTRNIGGGQAAVIYGLCGPISSRLCVSGDLTTSFPNVPTYSWEVMVTTHELGHLMGSRHTHACVWNGNCTAIDGCAGFTEPGCNGSCAVPGNPPGGGTIMSYCHLTVGINFNNGFGPQPAAQIRNSVEASACLTSCAEPPGPCTNPPVDLATWNVTTTTANIGCPLQGPNLTYVFEYRAVGTTTWTVISVSGPTLFPSAALYGLTPNTTYEWRVKLVCGKGGGGESPYAYSSFTTLAEGVPCGTPTNIGGSPDCGFSDVSWSAVPDATSYTLEYKKTSASTWNVQSGLTTTYSTIYGTGGVYNLRVKATCPAGTGNYGTGSTSIYSWQAPICEGNPKTVRPKEEVYNEGVLKLQPQPASDRVTLNYASTVQSPATVSIHSQFGTTMLRRQIQLTRGTNIITLDISNIKPGVYIVKLQAEGQSVSQKLVVGK